jgi:large subunit ribosomal protein L28
MARKCDICGKTPVYGNRISHAHNITKRRWNPNLRRMHVVLRGVHKTLRVCAACIRAGKVVRAG